MLKNFTRKKGEKKKGGGGGRGGGREAGKEPLDITLLFFFPVGVTEKKKG